MGGAPREGSARSRLPLVLGLLSGLVMLGCVSLLLVEYLAEVKRGPEEQGVVEALREQVRTDANAAQELHAVREQQTEQVLARKARAERIAWVLLVAGGLFVGCGKKIMTDRPQASPTLDALVADRFPPAAPARRKKRRKSPSSAPAPDEEEIDLAFVDAQIDKFGRGRESAIPLLQAIQTHYRYLPDEALRRICERTEVTPAQIAGTSSFYAQFRRSPVGRHVVRVCHGTACHVAGADQITQELRRHLGIPDGEDTDEKKMFTMDKVACVGCCSLAPVMMVEDETSGRLTPATARQAIDELAERS